MQTDTPIPSTDTTKTTMSGKLPFKIETLPKLEGQTDYARWADVIKLALEAYDLWDIFDGTRKRPILESEKGRGRIQLKNKSRLPDGCGTHRSG